MKRYLFDLALTDEQLMQFYKGSVAWVQATSLDGKSLRFRLIHLKPFITHTGVKGRFQITCTNDGEFISLQPIH